MSQADLESLPGAVGALMSGVRAAIEFGASLSAAADDRDLYLSRMVHSISWIRSWRSFPTLSARSVCESSMTTCGG